MAGFGAACCCREALDGDMVVSGALHGGVAASYVFIIFWGVAASYVFIFISVISSM
jgi:hypothetical protein